MQVFMPYPDAIRSVNCLDRYRLGNQIWRECKTIITGGWQHHPVSLIWRNHKPALADYAIRGAQCLHVRKWTTEDIVIDLIEFFRPYLISGPIIYPKIVGFDRFHESHRLNLLYKFPQWYTKFFDEEVPEEKPMYIWTKPNPKFKGLRFDDP
jgi:hypothetical protein